MPPDVKVVLSAEGQRQVTNALRQVQRETRATAQAGTQAFSRFGGAVAGVRNLIGQLAGVAAVAGIAAFLKNVSRTVDETAKLSERLGTTVERMSALSFAADLAGVPVRALNSTIPLLTQRVAEFAQGEARASGAFRALGISMDELRGKDTAEQMEVVARSFGRLKTTSGTTALAVELLGTSGAKLLPLFRDLADKGLAGIITEGRRAGLVIDNEVAAAIENMNDSITTLNQGLSVIAAQFLAGFAPAVVGAMQNAQAATSETGNTMIEFGRQAGEALVFVINLADRIATSFAKIGIAAGGMAAAVGALFRLSFKEAALIERVAAKQAAELEEAFLQRVEDRARRVEELRRDFARPRRPGATEEPAAIAGPGREERAFSGLEAEFPQTALEAFTEQAAAAERELRQLALESEAIEARVVQGVIKEAEAKDQILALERERLPGLQQTIAALAEIARLSGDPDAVLKVMELSNAIAVLGVQTKHSQSAFADFAKTAQEALVQGITDFFRTGIREAENFLDAVRNVIAGVFDALAQLAAQQIALGIGKAIFGKALQAGGLISGPGTGTSDSVPILASRGEFIVRAGAVAQPGVLPALQALNRGLATPALSGFRGARAFADGGLVDGAGVARHESVLTLNLGEGLVASQIETPAGERAVLRVLSKNRRSAAAALG